MLFWAGLRGAVGVALAAGFTGDNGNSLRATVLVVVVLTVIVFGGTTARMLEILGIRTGVMDEPDSDDEFDIESFGGRFYKSSANGFDGIGNTPAVALDDVGGGRGGYATGQQRPTPPSRSPSNPVLRNTSVGSSTTDLAENSDTESDASDLPPPARRTTFSMASTEVGSNGGMGLGETPPQQQLGGGGLSQWTGIFNVSGEDQAEWFRKLDEGFIKPTLLLDHDKGNGGPA
jgi:sodium/hydrogen exchanger-like protein 6/7